jgi:hypothetical protein
MDKNQPEQLENEEAAPAKKLLSINITFCNVVFLVFSICTTFQSEIIKKLLNSRLTCGTSIWGRSIYFQQIILLK